MSNLYSQFATDKKAESEGIVLSYGMNSHDEPIEIRIARAGGANQRFAKVFEAKIRPVKRQMQTETLDQKVADKLLVETYAEAIVLGWTGVEDRDGNAMTFSKENVVKLFTDLPDLFRDVQEASQKSALFREDILETDSKN